ncbi:rhomboid family intramembrane serine protease [Phytohalomonas tamaricis]|uniref:rhomboid family intramembrane serine protease n=1 Tax=Phytohalomonas tamaricis TaxID=2081032 RepID=UPI000D0B2F71|nr:rhomboid family intramembrane serine protease [Phytohalomonas tamaricis]
MPKALRFPHDLDLSPLRQALWAHRIGHHFTDDDEGQLIIVLSDAQEAQALELVARWQRGESLQPEGPIARSPGVLRSAFARAPVTTLSIIVCILCFALTAIIGDSFLAAMTIVPIGVEGEQLVYGNLPEALASGQIWRLLTPMLLHFGWMHLIFNMLWLWYFGRQIEALQGPLRFILLVVISGIIANLAQYATGVVLFGGMSGVDYALLGYVWLFSRLRPSSGFNIPHMLMIFMLIWLVLCMTPFADVIGYGNIANEAHLGGLLTGLACALIATRFGRNAGQQ